MIMTLLFVKAFNDQDLCLQAKMTMHHVFLAAILAH